MARFLRLTDAHPDRINAPLVINIDHIEAIRPHRAPPNTPDGELMRTCIIVTGHPIGYLVQETFDKITDALPN